MFSKQLLIGLLIGAACMGLGFLMFSTSGGANVAVSDSGNFKLLAQVLPDGEGSSTEEIATETGPADNVIEVRSVAPTPKKKTTATSTLIALTGQEEEDGEPVTEIRKCSYAEGGSKPALLGIISEVAWMGSADDSNAEWVEMQNHSKGDLDVSGWQLVDKAEQIRAIVPDGVVLSRNSFLVFEREPHQLAGATVLYKGVISNSNEGLKLFNADCGLQDAVAAGSKWPAGTNSPKYTAERGSDLSWHTYYGPDDAGVFGTPGQRNSAGAPPKVEEEPVVESASSTDSSAQASSSQEQAQTETSSTTEQVASSSDSMASSTASSTEPEPESEPEVPPIPVSSTSFDHLVISEVQITGGTGHTTDDYVEIFNPFDQPFNLNGYRLVKRTKTGTTDTSLKSWTTDIFVPAGGYYIWANSAYAAIAKTPDTTTAGSIADDNGVAIRQGSENTGTLIDSIGWGTAANAFVEGSVFATNPGANVKLQRKHWQDTDNNAADFEVGS